MSAAIVDLFAGPGGWDLGARAAGLPDPLGVEWGDEECATRLAAGLATLQGDVGQLDPRAVVADHFGATAALSGLIASPPCQAWSMAGKGKGRTHDADLCSQAAHAIANGMDTRAALAEKCQDHRSILVAEPLRWTLDLAPTWIAWEQVPPVLSYWELCATHLRSAGYRVWTGIVSAEQYGVPQTRKRAILLGARDGRPVHRPTPTHRRYLPPRKLKADVAPLFDPAPLQRPRIHAEDHGLVPWVSMAKALGWAEDALVGFPRRADTASNASRSSVVTIGGEDYRARDLRAANLPAQVVTEKARSWSRLSSSNDRGARVDRGEAGNAPRDTTAPAQTVGTRGGLLRWQDDEGESSAVELHEVCALQAFPGDFPLQGSRTAQFRQVGNAVPPLLAEHVLRAITTPKDRTR